MQTDMVANSLISPTRTEKSRNVHPTTDDVKWSWRHPQALNFLPQQNRARRLVSFSV